ncbi:MAG: chitobiase/beta-hexosaminidase C-terminal domain-containing protein [Phycisphaerae bacterium]|nr:chitobiase/beta-hexosaminidase C-terminal domain-containing protein [Phycisphaerae bacterium]
MSTRTIVASLWVLSVIPAFAAASDTLLTINEFVASNRTGLLDGDGRASDWIELYNSGTRAISLNGWHLTDNAGDLRKWPFPPGWAVPAKGFLVVIASGEAVDDYIDSKGYAHTNFALDKDGEYLALVDSNGEIAHEYAPSFPSQQTDISYGMQGGLLCYFLTPTPGKANGQGVLGLTAQTQHNPERGFYDEPFDLHVLCDTPDAIIRYTLDGSEPTEQYGIVHQAGTPIPITTTTVVRSIAYRTGWQTAAVSTHSYIFVGDVACQSATPVGWPAEWGYDSEVGGIVPADYEMDPRVVNSTLDGYSVREALLDIPTVSVSMLPDDFISDATGIWANPLSRWERKCSIEYLLPDGTDGFQCDCKIEVHGNSSRRPWRMQKHSLRLTFTTEYGPAKLRYPLFPESTVDRFNQLILRACFTDSWGLVTWMPARYRPNDSQYLRDIWMKESLCDMGQPSSHGDFVHLYVDGLYFGLYNLTERVGEDFFADHLGGEPEDWEVNEDFGSPGARWKAMMAVNPSTLAGYTQIQDYLDVEDFADYMLLHFYADAEDWPHHNGYAAANAVSGDGRFRFFVWDQEIVLDYHGRAASRIDATGGAGDLFQKMRTSEEFRLLFADRVYKRFFHEGALSLAGSQGRYRELADRIDKAIVAESARWGDTQMSTPYGNSIDQPSPLTDINHSAYPPAPHGPDYYFTREDSWAVERDNLLDNYIPAIHNTANSYAFLKVLRAKNLYPDSDPPEFKIEGVPQHGGSVRAGDALTLDNPNGTGAIYYTLDGTDPRVPGVASEQNSPNVLVAESAAKRVLIPGGNLGDAWRGEQPFDDSAWIPGAGGVGYERSIGFETFIGINVGTQMYGVNGSCYIRIPFELAVPTIKGLTGLVLRVRYDDGFVAYLNGVEVARDRFAGTPQWNSLAADSHADDQAVLQVEFDLTDRIDLLQAGGNLLAIHALNASPTSSDFLLSVDLVTGREESPADPSVAATATPYRDPILLTSDTRIKARVLDNGQWSALNEATYMVDR